MHTMNSQLSIDQYIDIQIKYESTILSPTEFKIFGNHESILILFGLCKWEYLSLTRTCCPKPRHSHTTCHLDTILD